MYAGPLYGTWAGDNTTMYASTILACLATVVLLPVYVIYWKGPVIRSRSKFAESLDAERKDKERRRSQGNALETPQA